jgi:hypothetical protein
VITLGQRSIVPARTDTSGSSAGSEVRRAVMTWPTSAPLGLPCPTHRQKQAPFFVLEIRD